VIVTPEVLTEALSKMPEKVSGKRALFGDVAAGRDENVLAECNGNTARIVAKWVERDTFSAANRFCKHFSERNAKDKEIWIDADGLGINFVKHMHENGRMVRGFYGGRPALEDDRYAHEITEVWNEAITDIINGRIHIVGGLDPETFRQITTRRVEWDAKGRLKLESKEKMRERGLPSPDRADALLGAIFKARSGKSGFSESSKMMVPTSSPMIVPSLRF
jgi:hypothetical protein